MGRKVGITASQRKMGFESSRRRRKKAGRASKIKSKIVLAHSRENIASLNVAQIILLIDVVVTLIWNCAEIGSQEKFNWKTLSGRTFVSYNGAIQ